MKAIRVVLFLFLAIGIPASPAFATTTHRPATTHSKSRHVVSHSHARSRTAARSHRLHGQQVIDSRRVTQIQQALARQHYLSEEPNGQWDAATQAAMQKYQADQGWQTRLTPDSRALVKLGLGPDYSSAINAKDIASTPPPPAGSANISSQQAGFAAASGVNQ